MSLQFGRRTWLIIGAPGSEGRRFEGLRTAFDVTKADGQAINTARVQLYNASPTTAAAARAPGAILQLHAGYGESAGLCYLGEIVRATPRAERPESVLEIECGDGQAARGVSIAATRAGSNILGDVLGTLSDATGLDLSAPADLLGAQLPAPRGVSLSGPALVQINRIIRMARLDWTIEDGAIVITRAGEATRLPALVVSPETGLLGSPEPGQKGRLVVKMRLQPGARLRRILRVESRAVTGWYLVRRVRHYGDSGWGDDYTTECECTEIRPRRAA